MDTLPVYIEGLVVKIYKFFHIYIVQVSELKEFCDFADVEYQRLMQCNNTRFLSLLPALEWVLEMFKGTLIHKNIAQLSFANVLRIQLNFFRFWTAEVLY